MWRGLFPESERCPATFNEDRKYFPGIHALQAKATENRPGRAPCGGYTDTQSNISYALNVPLPVIEADKDTG